MARSFPRMYFVLFTLGALYCKFTLWLHDCYGHHAAAAAAAGNTAVFSAFCVTISSSIYNCSDRRLMFAGHRVYRPSISRCREPVLSALLLLLGGVEQNPGPTTAGAAGTLKHIDVMTMCCKSNISLFDFCCFSSASS